jgi:xanthine dehydrogenase accessory factor
MFDIYRQLQIWSDDPDKLPIYLATVISVEGSAVRGAGATMGIAADGALAGSVSGGCIESTVIEAVKQLRPQRASREITFCPSDDPFEGAPSPCGGTVKVCLYPYAPEIGAAVAQRCVQGQDISWGVCTDGPEELTGFSFAFDDAQQLRIGRGADPETDTISPEITAERIAALIPREYGTFEATAPAPEAIGAIGASGVPAAEKAELKLFIQHHPPIPHAAVVGGAHIGAALVQQLKALGWRVSVIDPREAFAPQTRFSAADKLLHMWPQEAFVELGIAAGQPTAEHTAVAAITHSEQIDDAAVAAGLESGCFYVGVLGSRRTFGERMERLQRHGFSSKQIDRVHGPIGLDIGAQSPEEIALAIAAQMVQDYRKGR